MTNYTGDGDPLDLRSLYYSEMNTAVAKIEQQDLPDRTHVMPDGKTLRVWTTRFEISPDLLDHVERVLNIPSHHPDFPFPDELTAPVFHASVGWPNLPPTDRWNYMRSVEHLELGLAEAEGITMPVQMGDDLHADSTLAIYGDLHVEHISAVLRMEAADRDLSRLVHFNGPTGMYAAAEQMGILSEYRYQLQKDLRSRRTHTREQDCSEFDLIGAHSDEWTLERRIDELRGWPSGPHATQVIDELDCAIAHDRDAPDADELDTIWADHYDWDSHGRGDRLRESFSTDMSQARVKDWGCHDTFPPAPPAHRAHQIAVDRGVRYEPAPQPPPVAFSYSPQPTRPQTAPFVAIKRRPSM